MSRHEPARPLHRSTTLKRNLAGTLLGLTLGACASTAPPPPPTVAAPATRDQVVVRQESMAQRAEDEAARQAAEEAAAQAAAEEAFAACRDEGLLLERSARATANAGQYKRAALILESCLEEAERSGAIAAETRMPVMALAIQSHAKAGDVARARDLLQGFEARFAGLDLYFADGTSFIESVALALGDAAETQAGVFSTANVNPTLKADLRRQRYWQSN